MSKLSCNYCGSSDAGHQYEDGYFCFSCKHKTFNEDRKKLGIKKVSTKKLVGLDTHDLQVATKSNPMLLKAGINIHDNNQVLEDLERSLYFSTVQHSVWHKRTIDKKCSFIGQKDPTKPCLFYLEGSANAGTVVLVEDPISALKVSQAANHQVCALFGTHLSTVNKCWVAMNFYKVILWLDADKPGKIASLKIARQLRDIFPDIKVIYHQEPKLCSEDEISEQLKRLL